MELSIIILNYNTPQLTLNCINSIIKFTQNISYEIIVVDNASSPPYYQELSKSLIQISKNIKLIRSLHNLGFSTGNNKAIDYVIGKYVCFINSDILLLENSMKIFYEFMEQTPNAGVCSGIQLDKNFSASKINFGHYHNLKREILGDRILEFIFNKPSRKKKYLNPIKIDFCSGCLIFFKTKFYKMVGGFDNSIFLYYEEMDICKRLKNYNLNSYHVPYTKYIHLGGASTKIGYEKKIELIISLLYVIRKNDGFLNFILLKWCLTLKFLFKSIIKPIHFKIFWLLITLGSPLAHSMKNKQSILSV